MSSGANNPWFVLTGLTPDFAEWVCHITDFAITRGRTGFTTREAREAAPEVLYSGSNRDGRTRSALRRLVAFGYLDELPGFPYRYQWTGKPWPPHQRSNTGVT